MDLWFAGVGHKQLMKTPTRTIQVENKKTKKCCKCGKISNDLQLTMTERNTNGYLKIALCPTCRDKVTLIDNMVTGMAEKPAFKSTFLKNDKLRAKWRHTKWEKGQDFTVQEDSFWKDEEVPREFVKLVELPNQRYEVFLFEKIDKPLTFHKGNKICTKWPSDKWNAGQIYTAQYNSFWKDGYEFVRLAELCPDVPMHACQFELVKMMSLDDFVKHFKNIAKMFEWRQRGLTLDNKWVWVSDSNPNCLRGYWKDKNDFSFTYDPAEAVCKVCLGYDIAEAVRKWREPGAFSVSIREKLSISEEDYEKLFHAMNDPIDYCDAMLKSELFAAAGKV